MKNVSTDTLHGYLASKIEIARRHNALDRIEPLVKLVEAIRVVGDLPTLDTVEPEYDFEPSTTHVRRDLSQWRSPSDEGGHYILCLDNQLLGAAEGEDVYLRSPCCYLPRNISHLWTTFLAMHAFDFKGGCYLRLSPGEFESDLRTSIAGALAKFPSPIVSEHDWLTHVLRGCPNLQQVVRWAETADKNDDAELLEVLTALGHHLSDSPDESFYPQWPAAAEASE